MNVIYKDKVIKRIPNRYEPIAKDALDLILFEDSTRMHPEEITAFDKALLNHYFNEAKKTLKPNEREYIGKARARDLFKITKRDGSVEYHIYTTNGKRLRVNKKKFPSIHFTPAFEW